MKRSNYILYRILMLAVALVIIQGCSDDKHKQHKAEGALKTRQKYTCPMHPQVIEDAPGHCPICGMELVPVKGTASKQMLELSARQIELANIKTMKAGKGASGTAKLLNGRIVSNPELTEVVSSRYQGRIERLFVKETGDRLSRGQPLYEIYSEQLQTLQQDYLLQLRQASAFPGERIYRDLRDAARNKLLLFGVSDSQISALAKSGKASPRLTVYSAVSGVVRELNVSEGQYISEGTPLMQIEGYGTVWVEADVYPDEAATIKTGTPVKIVAAGFEDRPRDAHISFIGPQLTGSSQIITVRASVPNPGGELQPGMQVTVVLPQTGSGSMLKLPLDAVIRDGKGAKVWVKTGRGQFQSRNVLTGDEDERQIQVTSGLAAGDEVVVSGAYLLNSEYVLRKGN